MAPDFPSVIDTYGWILFKNGDLEKARILLEKASELAPNNQAIKAHLSICKESSNGIS